MNKQLAELYAPSKSKVLEAAKGRWLGIYQQLAPELSAAQGKPGKSQPCPIHGGKDGFRVFKKTADSTGGGICQTCGFMPDGLALLMKVRDWGFHEALQEVGSLLGVEDKYGNCGSSAPAKKIIRRDIPKQVVKQVSDEWLKWALAKVWKESLSLTDEKAEPARLYLRSRAILAWDRPGLERAVRFHPNLSHRDENGKRTSHPAIVAMISDKFGEPVTIHRTYLTRKGEKADLADVKMMFPIPSACSIVGGGIAASQPGEIIDVSEGLETALSIETAMGFPVWPLVNAYLLENFVPPPSVKAVRIWADKDRSGAGLSAATNLVKRLWGMGIKARILVPQLDIPKGEKGLDWNDVLYKHGKFEFLNSAAYRKSR